MILFGSADEVSMGNLLMEGIHDKTGKIPLDGAELEIELPLAPDSS